MNSALEKLRRHIIRNALDVNYPTLRPSINTTDLHIEIYKLIDEYVGLFEDLKKVTTQSSKKFIEERMQTIERELTKFWIVPDSKMVPPPDKN